MSLRLAIGWCVALAYRVLKPHAFNRWIVVHHLEPAQFERIIGWYHRRGRDRELEITFDDGWKEVAEYAKTLERYGLKAKLFIAPHETERGNVWTEEATQLGVSAEEWRTWYSLSVEAREAKLEDARKVRGIASVRRTLLTREELAALPRCIEIENHTMTHPSATSRPAEEIVAEISAAQKALTEWFGKVPRYLAWPFGRGNAELDARVRAMGLEPVYTNLGRPNGRTMAIEGMSFRENLGRLLGAWPRVGETL